MLCIKNSLDIVPLYAFSVLMPIAAIMTFMGDYTSKGKTTAEEHLLFLLEVSTFIESDKEEVFCDSNLTING